MKNLKTAGMFCLLSLFGCATAHHRDVRPGEGGINTVLTHGGERPEAERDAIAQANHYCQQFKKNPVFLKENTSYQGTMDEKTRKVVKGASNAGWVMSGANSGIETASGVGMMMTNDDPYVSEMKFKCR